MFNRKTFIVRFKEHSKPYHVSGEHITEAQEQARYLAHKYHWTVASVGLRSA